MNKKAFIPIFLALFLITSVFSASTLGVSNVDFSDNGDAFSKQFLILLAENGRSDFYQATISKSQLSSDEAEAQNSITIKTDITASQCVYDLKTGSSPEYLTKLGYYSELDNPFTQTSEDKCKAKAGSLFFVKPLVATLYCVYETNDAIVGLPPSEAGKQYSQVEEVTISTGTKSETLKLSNDPSLGDRSASTSNVVAKWEGNIVSGKSCPDMLSTTPVYKAGSGWRLVSTSSLNAYLTERKTFDLNARNIDFILDNPVAQLVEKVNKLEEQALSPRDSSFTIEGVTGTILGTSSNGKLVFNNVQQFQFPLTTLKINADWVGIIQPKTKPVITKLTSQEFTEGKTGYIVAEVRNDGADGSVSYSVSCPNPFDTTGTGAIIKISKGETKTINIPITGDSMKVISDSCSITIQDESDPSIKVTKSVTVKMSPIVLCEVGEKRCNGKFIEQCQKTDEADATWSIISECDTLCEQKSNEFFCGEVKVTEEQEDKSPVAIWIFLGTLILGTLISYFIIANYIPIKNKWGKFALVLTIALIIGVIVATLLTFVIGLVITAFESATGWFW